MFGSADQFKRQASTAKRLAGGLRSNLESAKSIGLTRSDSKVLEDAIALLNKLSSIYKQAEKLSVKKRADKEAAEKAMLTAMGSTFGSLQTVADKVALIGAVSSYLLRTGCVRDRFDLDEHFKSTKLTLAGILVRQQKEKGAAVAEAWEKFSNGRSDIERQYQGLIDRLGAEAP